jgi:hypothetical protein
MPTGANEENIYRVLDQGVTRDLFVETAEELGLIKHHTWSPTQKEEAYEEVWATPDQTRAIHYVEDPVSGMPYVCIRGTDVASLVADFTSKLSCFWPEELIERAYYMTDHKEQRDNLYRLAITFPEYTPEVFAIFEGFATTSPDPSLRWAALGAMAYRVWPECRTVVEGVAQEDKDERVRRSANDFLVLWEQQSPSSKA